LEEATREFEVAVRQSHGKFVEASQNLARCRQMLNASSPGMIASLKIVEGEPGARMKTE